MSAAGDELPPSLGEPNVRRADKDDDYGHEVWSVVCSTCGYSWFGRAWESCNRCIERLEDEHGRFDEYQSAGPTPPPAPWETGDVPSITDKFLTIAQLAALPPPQPLIEGILDLDNVSITYGRRGSYKSFVVLDQALCVASGIAWHGHDVTLGTVVYVVGEGRQGVYQRIDAWLSQWPGKDPADRLLILPEAVNLLDDASVNAFAAGCLDVGASFVILDTLARCIPGGDENSARDMGIAVAAMDTIRQVTGAHVDAVHHSGKDSKAGARGSSALEGAADTVLEVTKTDTNVTITHTKQKNRAEGPPLRLVARPVRQSVVLDPADNAHVTVTPKPRQALRILDEIAGGIGETFTAWVEACAEEDIARTTVRRIRKQAVDEGWIENGPNSSERTPRYVLTDAGRAIAETDGNIGHEQG